jgi:ribosomal protein S18 acetylase RimI-like enzyme
MVRSPDPMVNEPDGPRDREGIASHAVAIEIREARPEEHAEAGRVTAEAYREFVEPGEPLWERYLEHIADVPGRADRTTVLVAVGDGRILGSATLELDGRVDEDEDGPLAPGEAHIRMLGIASEARGRGLARALMAVCEDRARSHGAMVMTLHTTHRMRAAQRMYAALGYDRLPDRVLDDGFVLLSFSKRL